MLHSGVMWGWFVCVKYIFQESSLTGTCVYTGHRAGGSVTGNILYSGQIAAAAVQWRLTILVSRCRWSGPRWQHAVGQQRLRRRRSQSVLWEVKTSKAPRYQWSKCGFFTGLASSLSIRASPTVLDDLKKEEERSPKDPGAVGHSVLDLQSILFLTVLCNTKMKACLQYKNALLEKKLSSHESHIVVYCICRTGSAHTTRQKPAFHFLILIKTKSICRERALQTRCTWHQSVKVQKHGQPALRRLYSSSVTDATDFFLQLRQCVEWLEETGTESVQYSPTGNLRI